MVSMDSLIATNVENRQKKLKNVPCEYKREIYMKRMTASDDIVHVFVSINISINEDTLLLLNIVAALLLAYTSAHNSRAFFFYYYHFQMINDPWINLYISLQ